MISVIWSSKWIHLIKIYFFYFIFETPPHIIEIKHHQYNSCYCSLNSFSHLFSNVIWHGIYETEVKTFNMFIHSKPCKQQNSCFKMLSILSDMSLLSSHLPLWAGHRGLGPLQKNAHPPQWQRSLKTNKKNLILKIFL